jgi:membrane protease YdiL (CAAX protease family)
MGSELSARDRTISAVEAVFAALLIVARAMYPRVPNEVIVLFIIGLVSLRVRNGGWGAIGIRRPESWPRILGTAVAAAAIRIGIGDGVLVPALTHLFPAPHESSIANDLVGNLKALAMLLGLVWTFAAIGEEFCYRGYIWKRVQESVGKHGDWIALAMSAVLFGLGHAYKGPVGIIDSGFAGLVLGTAYLLNRKNLWASILTHGFIDTFGVVVTFFGWAD